MRTVTFSNAEVATVVNDHFIATWVNRQPGFHNCDNAEEERIRKFDAFATKNFCTFFTNADLDVLHYGSGHQGPAVFLRELTFVLELKKKVLDGRNRYMEDAFPEFQELHAAHAALHDRQERRLRETRPSLDGGDFAVFHSRRAHHAQGLIHLHNVHHDLIARARAHDGPVPLSEVFNDYLFANGFEETIKGDRNREKPKNPGMR